jgi:hypothetical protein
MIEYESEPGEYESEPGEAFGIFGRGRRPTRPTGPQGVGYRPQPQAAYVTKAELQAVTDRIDRDFAATRTGLQQVGSRIDAFAAQHTRDITKIRQEARQQAELSALLPLLMRPQTRQITTATNGLQAGDRVVVDGSDTFATLLPLLLVGGGLGGSGTTGGGGLFGGDSSGMLVLALAMSRR